MFTPVNAIEDRVLNGPVVWDLLLAQLKPLFPNIILAGGAVRDYHVIGDKLGPKDFDFFVPVEEELELEFKLEELKAIADEARWLEPGMKGAEDYETDENGEIVLSPNLRGVIEAWIELPLKEGDPFPQHCCVNIIGKRPEAVADPTELFSDFDHSLCRAAYRDGEIVASPEFTKSLDTSVIERYNDDERTTTRINNLYGTGNYDRFFPEKVKEREEWRAKQKAKQQKFAEMYGLRTGPGGVFKVPLHYTYTDEGNLIIDQG